MNIPAISQSTPYMYKDSVPIKVDFNGVSRHLLVTVEAKSLQELQEIVAKIRNPAEQRFSELAKTYDIGGEAPDSSKSVTLIQESPHEGAVIAEKLDGSKDISRFTDITKLLASPAPLSDRITQAQRERFEKVSQVFREVFNLIPNGTYQQPAQSSQQRRPNPLSQSTPHAAAQSSPQPVRRTPQRGLSQPQHVPFPPNSQPSRQDDHFSSLPQRTFSHDQRPKTTIKIEVVAAPKIQQRFVPDEPFDLMTPEGAEKWKDLLIKFSSLTTDEWHQCRTWIAIKVDDSGTWVVEADKQAMPEGYQRANVVEIYETSLQFGHLSASPTRDKYDTLKSAIEAATKPMSDSRLRSIEKMVYIPPKLDLTLSRLFKKNKMSPKEVNKLILINAKRRLYDTDRNGIWGIEGSGAGATELGKELTNFSDKQLEYLNAVLNKEENSYNGIKSFYKELNAFVMAVLQMRKSMAKFSLKAVDPKETINEVRKTLKGIEIDDTPAKLFNRMWVPRQVCADLPRAKNFYFNGTLMYTNTMPNPEDVLVTAYEQLERVLTPKIAAHLTLLTTQATQAHLCTAQLSRQMEPQYDALGAFVTGMSERSSHIKKNEKGDYELVIKMLFEIKSFNLIFGFAYSSMKIIIPQEDMWENGQVRDFTKIPLEQTALNSKVSLNFSKIMPYTKAITAMDSIN